MKFFVILILVGSMLTSLNVSGINGFKSDEDEIKSTLKAMWLAIEQGDINKYASHLHPHFSSFGEANTYLAEGKALEVYNVGEWIKKAKNVHTEMHQPKVTIRGITGWITYYWTDSGEDGGKPFSSRGKSTRIFIKEKNRWLCIHAHHTLVK